MRHKESYGFRKSILNISTAMLCVLCGCAKISAPTGGAKDVAPPAVTKMEPDNGSLNFKDKQIRIYFDEYVTINNPNENVLISPPLKTAPSYSIQGKSLIIKFNDTLRENTTYNFVLSDCIKDFHEGNPLDFYHFSFSTGENIDKHSIQGRILDAKTLVPAKDFYITLYKNDVDSLPLTSFPDYVSKSKADGRFTFSNIAEGKYKIFAVKDINADLKFNLPNEEIAFHDEMVEAAYISNDNLGDTVKPTFPEITLFSFMPDDTVQKLMRYENPENGVYKFPYKRSFKEFSVEKYGNAPEHFLLTNPTRDTVTMFFKEIVTDSLSYILHADGQTDTVYLAPFKAKQSQGRSQNRSKEKLNITYHNAGEINKPLTLHFSYPVKPVDSAAITILTKENKIIDTSLVYVSIDDSLVLEMPVSLQFTEKKSYTIVIGDSLFWGYNNLTNDSLQISFTSKTEKDYGTLIMNYELPEDGKQYVATLKRGEQIIGEQTLTKSETITYPFLLPDKYTVMVFRDDNRNGRWDVGDYGTKRQPEKVIFFPSTISIRAYWDSEETFKIDGE